MNGSMFIGTWWALVPPLLAILLAFVTKEVYSSLFIGSAVGVLLYTGFHPWDAFTSFFEILRNSMNINILIFDILLGMVVVLMAKSGGSAAYGKWAGTKIKTKRSALLATMGLGVLIFVDDYFNCLTVGSVMRPGHGQPQGFPRETRIHHRLHRSADLHYRADLKLGGSRQLVCAGGCGNQRIPAVSADNSV